MTYEERKLAYSKVKTPNELLVFMDEYIKYGIFGTDNKIYDDWEADTNSEFQVACQTKYALNDIERYLKTGYGTCWDQVELERDWFSKFGYEFKTLFIWFLFEDDNNYTTHTYLIYKDKTDDKYCYFEHADSNNYGIHKFNTYKEAVEYQKGNHIKSNESHGNKIDEDVLSHLVIYEFQHPKYYCSMNEYIDNILKSKVIYKDDKYL